MFEAVSLLVNCPEDLYAHHYVFPSTMRDKTALPFGHLSQSEGNSSPAFLRNVPRLGIPIAQTLGPMYFQVTVRAIVHGVAVTGVAAVCRNLTRHRFAPFAAISSANQNRQVNFT
jgi:hypothetical protein